MRTHKLDGESLTPDAVCEVAEGRVGEVEVRLSESALKRMERSRRFVEQAVSRRMVIYGLTTGFGANADKVIDTKQVRQLQRNLIESHCCGVGEPFGREVVRAAMLIRANSLAKGASGVRPQLVDLLCGALNRGLVPVVPSRGSVGASGDLVPLAHMAFVLTAPPDAEMRQKERLLAAKARAGKLSSEEKREARRLSGLAWFWRDGWHLASGIEAASEVGLERLVLEAKEGLGFINGTSFSAALGCLALVRGEAVLSALESGVALAAEAMRGFAAAWSAEAMNARPQRGQAKVAKRLCRLVANSDLVRQMDVSQSVENPAAKFGAVQDAYCLRCAPQVLGVLEEALPLLRRILTTEINSASDNPLVLPDLPYPNKAVSAGNFHGQVLGWALDCTRAALVSAANLAERLTALLLDAKTNRGLPPFLTPDAGLNSGLMLLQYTAVDLTAECRMLTTTTAHSLPTSAGQEDVVSLSPLSGRATLAVLEACADLAAILALCAYQALFLRLKEKELKTAQLGDGTRSLYARFAQNIPPVLQDRPLWQEIATARRLLNLWQSKPYLEENAL